MSVGCPDLIHVSLHFTRNQLYSILFINLLPLSGGVQQFRICNVCLAVRTTQGTNRYDLPIKNVLEVIRQTLSPHKVNIVWGISIFLLINCLSSWESTKRSEHLPPSNVASGGISSFSKWINYDQ